MIQLSDFYGYSMYTISSDTLSVSVMSLGATVWAAMSWSA